MQKSGSKWLKVVQNYYVCLGGPAYARSASAGKPGCALNAVEGYDNHYTSMTFFTSEYESKLDAKGRLVLPARIKAQLPESGGNELVIRRGFEQCLILYPMVEFRKVFSKISGLNEFNEEYRKLQRNFLSGVVTVELDNNGRFLIPKNMLAYAHIEKDAMLVGTGNKVEVWNPGIYEKHIIQDPGELSKLAEKYLNE